MLSGLGLLWNLYSNGGGNFKHKNQSAVKTSLCAPLFSAKTSSKSPSRGFRNPFWPLLVGFLPPSLPAPPAMPATIYTFH